MSDTQKGHHQGLHQDRHGHHTSTSTTKILAFLLNGKLKLTLATLIEHRPSVLG